MGGEGRGGERIGGGGSYFMGRGEGDQKGEGSDLGR
jgi:hypothetical protein